MQIGRIPYADLHSEYLECQVEVDTAIARCIANSSFINGPEVLNFEQQWASYTCSPACAGVSSGTSALMLALLAVGVGSGDEVIVPTMSFIATAEVVNQIGATPIFADVDKYYTLDLNTVANSITERTRAIVFVDLYGQTVDIDQLKTIAGDVPLIEDAAQASGCRYLGQPVGNLVAATCFSFYPGKNLSAIGDAGAVTGSAELVARIKMLRDHGRTQKYVHEIIGWNERLDGLQAAVLAAKLPYLDRWNSRRQQNAQVYQEHLKDCADIVLPALNPASNHVYNQFVICTPHRDNLRQFLLDYNIETGIQFPLAMHQQPVYATADRLPGAELLASTCLSLPVHAQLTADEICHVADLVKYFFTLPAHSVEQNNYVTIPN
jgi:dTDP-4-amino-4,6-dideoxygalactose transaminase